MRYHLLFLAAKGLPADPEPTAWSADEGWVRR